MKIDRIQARIESFKNFGNQLPGAKVGLREDWGTIYFGLLGKQFGMMTPQADASAIITLKNTPAKNEHLRQTYPNVVVPGYYANKKHWNSIYLESDELDDEMIQDLIKESYDLVYQKLTKKEKALLE